MHGVGVLRLKRCRVSLLLAAAREGGRAGGLPSDRIQGGDRFAEKDVEMVTNIKDTESI